MKRIIILGAGGNSKVILDVLEARKVLLKEDFKILGFLDDNVDKKQTKNFPVLGKIQELEHYKTEEDVFIVDGIGSNDVRKKLYERYDGIKWYTAIHPTAIIGSGVTLGAGTIVMPGAIINVDSQIGIKALINTGSIVEHDNKIGDFAHLASGVTTAGNVTVGELTMLGTGAKVIQGITIGSNTIIGAGATIINDIPSNCTAVGTPAKVIIKK